MSSVALHGGGGGGGSFGGGGGDTFGGGGGFGPNGSPLHEHWKLTGDGAKTAVPDHSHSHGSPCPVAPPAGHVHEHVHENCDESVQLLQPGWTESSPEHDLISFWLPRNSQ